MIEYVKRKNLDVLKYDACIENSIQSKIYAFSWYLDIVSDNWDVLVLDNYEAVMPIPWRKKYGIKYVYPPFWLLELGIYSKEIIDENEFLIHLLDEFKYVELIMNSNNSFNMFHDYLETKQKQELSIASNYDILLNNFKRDRRKDLKKANKLDLTEKWNDDPKQLIKLFHDNVGQRVKKIGRKDYLKLFNLVEACINKGLGEVLSIYDKDNKIVAAGFFLKEGKTITLLVSSTDFSNRKNGANTFLIDRALFKYLNNFEVFNFGGSSIKSIAKYFLSFGAKTENFHQIKYNNLPFILRYFKR